MKSVILLAVLTSMCNAKSPLLDTSRALLSRQKRTLVYQEGLNWVQMVVGIGLPIEIKDHSITMGAVVKSYYELPNNSTQYTHPTIDIQRRKRSISRWQLYDALGSFARSLGHGDGKTCVLRTICESSSAPFDDKSGLFAEILHLLLTPSTTEEPVESHFDREYHAAEKLGRDGVDDCRGRFPCDWNFMGRFTKVFL